MGAELEAGSARSACRLLTEHFHECPAYATVSSTAQGDHLWRLQRGPKAKGLLSKGFKQTFMKMQLFKYLEKKKKKKVLLSSQSSGDRVPSRDCNTNRLKQVANLTTHASALGHFSPNC